MPLIMRIVRNIVAYYPMEVLIVEDNQRIKSFQQTPSQIQVAVNNYLNRKKQIKEMVKKTAIPPALHFQHTMQIQNSLGLTTSEPLRRCDIQFDENPIEVDARLIDPCLVQFRYHRSEQPTPRWDGRGCQFFIPAECEKWAAIAFSNGRAFINQQTWEFVLNLFLFVILLNLILILRSFLHKFIEEMKKRGMRFEIPMDVRIYASQDLTGLKTIFQRYQDSGVEFLLVGQPDNADEVHRN